MKINSKFQHLVKSNRDNYKSYLNQKSFENFSNLLNKKYDIAFEEFQKLVKSSNDSILNNISNPFYIGMGNPESKILIFGQELALDTNKNNPSSILGFFQEQLYHHSFLLEPAIDFFNPYIANNYRKIIKNSHTWGLYSRWIGAIKDNDSNLYKKYLYEDPRNDFFENHCFYTELYHKPSSKHIKSETSEERMNFFGTQDFRDFFATFDIVLIGCNSFYKEYDQNKNPLSRYFGLHKNDISLEERLNYSNKKGILIKTVNNQKIAIFNYQFSSAWSNKYLNEVSLKIKNL